MEFLCIASTEKSNSANKSIYHPSSFLILHLSSTKAVKETPANFPQKNKGFINYVFCRNLAVRIPAVTRLDSSSLVNKQVASNVAIGTLGTFPIDGL